MTKKRAVHNIYRSLNPLQKSFTTPLHLSATIKTHFFSFLMHRSKKGAMISLCTSITLPQF